MGIITDDVERIARKSPEAPAVVEPTSVVSYGSLLARIEHAEDALRGVGISKGELVAIHGRTSARQIACLLAAWRLGGVVWLSSNATDVPPVAEPGEDPTLLTVVTDGRVAEPAQVVRRRAPRHVAAAVVDLARARSEVERAGGAYVVRTSGSTGSRKFILGSLAALSSFVEWQRNEFAFTPADRVAALTGVEFDVVFREILTPLSAGASVVCPPAEMRPGKTLAWLRACRASVVHAVPSLGRFWLSSAAPGVGRPDEAPDLRATFFAGEPLDGHLARTWRSITGSDQLLVNLYGPSETTLAKFCYVVPADYQHDHIPVGHPIPGTSMRLEARGESSSSGVGEVVIRTRDGSLGYLGTVSPAAERNLSRVDGLTTFRTGDLGRMGPDGLELVGRLDSRLKINGTWVDTHSIETSLRSLDRVADAAVFGIDTGHGTKVHALIAGDWDDKHDLRQVRSHVLRILGAASVPSVIVTTDALPTLPSGKIDRVLARELCVRRGTA